MSHPIIQDEQINHLAPSLFSSRRWPAETDADVREQFFRIYKPLRDKGMQDYHLSRIATALYYYRPMLADILGPTQTKCVVEIGSGRGAKAVSWAGLFKSYVGIELRIEDVAETNEVLRQCGVNNARVVCGNAEAVIDQPQRYDIDRIDLLVLFAVIEHLTIPERKVVLQLAERVYRQGGHVLIAESPNRLCRLDQHTWQLPFTDWLPLEIAAEYAAKSQRDHLKRILNASSPDQRAEALYRIGRGVSYHEFECFWEKSTYDELGVVNDGYSTELLNYYPFVHDEWDLLRFCTDNNVNVGRLFTRYYLEGIFCQSAPGARKGARFLSPLEMPITHRWRRFWRRNGHDVPRATTVERRRFWEMDEVSIGPGDSLLINAEYPSAGKVDSILLVDIERSSGRLIVEEIKSGTRSVIDLAKLAAARMPIWHTRAALPLESSGGGTYRLRLEGSESRLTSHGMLLL
jgi:SAM-dependent methyltransferase